MTTRRNLLVLGGLAGAVIALQKLGPLASDLFAGDFEFAPIDGLPGFRRVIRDGTDISAGVTDPFVGLQSSDEIRAAPPGPIRKNICDVVFGTAPAATPIAVFTDYNCPYCRVLERNLAEIAAEDPEISLNFLNLPLLGPGSLLGAKAAIAGDLQDGFAAIHASFMRPGVVIHVDFIEAEADRLGLDADRLIRDMNGPTVTRRIAQNKALAGIFGVIGTPAIIVGRSFALGALSKTRLRDLIETERASGPLPCSTG